MQTMLNTDVDVDKEVKITYCPPRKAAGYSRIDNITSRIARPYVVFKYNKDFAITKNKPVLLDGYYKSLIDAIKDLQLEVEEGESYIACLQRASRRVYNLNSKNVI